MRAGGLAGALWLLWGCHQCACLVEAALGPGPWGGSLVASSPVEQVDSSQPPPWPTGQDPAALLLGAHVGAGSPQEI